MISQAVTGHNRVRAGFWRRLAATWVDWFVICALAAFLVEFAALVGIRIALDPLFVVAGAAYGCAMLASWTQTVGKMLLGLAVTTKTGGKPRLRDVLLREAIGKWGMAFAAPAALGREIVGQAWVPTVYDLLILLPVLAVLFLHYLIAKRTWYDWLGGTTVERVSGIPGRAKPAFVALMAAAALGLGTKATEYAIQGWLPCRLSLYRSMRSTAPYVAFLKQEHQNPIDYVFSLFDDHDVVVLCERMHPEASQWDFIYELIRDPRFRERVGHVFTEYGQVGMQKYLDEFMATDGLPPDEVHERVVHIMRHFPVWPTWTNTNAYTYFTRLYQLNQSLPSAKRIRHHFTDAAVNWAEITTEEQYQAYRRALEDRDRQMAQTVIAEIGRLARSQTRPPKCLVVMNYRHAFDLTGRSPEARRWDTYEYLRDAFEMRAANVLLGAYYVFNPTAGGVWDTAFAEAGDPRVGFDFAGSPFGEDAFDIFPLPAARTLTYRDVFTGFVYAQPLGKQYLEHGVPGYYEGFEDEVLRRAKLLGEDAVPSYQDEIEQERAGIVPIRQQMPNHVLESILESCPLALTGTGLLIGVASFWVGRHWGRSRRKHVGD
jgi:uncharacterized RDD family membrane protein YckC